MDRPRFRRYFRHGLLPQLIAFEACVRLGGVTRAAEELCLAQPTVSGLLKRLSDTIGEPVLVARRGRMEPTPAGRHLAALCHDIFASFERFESRREPGVEPRQARIAGRSGAKGAMSM
ncbi:MAG TPA: LysR family transcriptional regulator [Usitatibacter sp.]|jgi:DNA-binding transcriptional LysR family regulator|nr:LysR family transcriptional regulator [Usitatibacter sp.]